MESPTLLVCTFGDYATVVKVCPSFCRSRLLQILAEKWNHCSLNSVSLFYSIPGYKKFMLDNDVDYENMICLANLKGVNNVDIIVVSHTNNVSGGGGNVGDDTAMGGLPLDVLDDANGMDQLFSFCPHNEKELLSSNWSSRITHVGQGFPGGASEFRNILCKFAIQSRFQFKYVKNDTVRVTAVCSLKEYKGCGWYIHARCQKSNGYFYILKWNNVHTCGAVVRTTKHPKAGSELVSNLVLDRVRDKPLTRPTDVVYDMKIDYGLDISYRVAWLGVEKARGELDRSHLTSFDQLRWYTNEVKRCNPGSYIHLQCVSATSRFKRIFISFRACIDGFNHCRPLLFLDGTFLKGRYKGSLLAATGKNGNQGLFPVAFAVVDSENEDNWLWFLKHLEQVLDKNRTITFISDRNVGLLEAMPVVFPKSHHGFCLQHLKANMRDKLRGFHNGTRDELVRKLNECAYAPTKSLFHTKLNELKAEGCGRLDDFFNDLPHENWANAYFRGKRYGEMSSNAAESFNSWIREARHLPITRLVDAIRTQIMKQMADRRENSARWVGAICPAIETKLEKAFESSRSWIVSKANDVVYEVHCFPSVMVNIDRRQCSCYQWQLNGIPCAHAVIAIQKSGNNLNACVDPFFHIATYRQSYATTIFPIPTVEKPQFNLEECIILPPNVRRPPGRPKSLRIQSKGEKLKQIRCSRCGRMGNHNRKSCKEPM